MTSFMRPLSNEVWLVLASSVLVGGLALWFISRTSPVQQQAVVRRLEHAVKPHQEQAVTPGLEQAVTPGLEQAVTPGCTRDGLINLPNALWVVFGASVLQGETAFGWQI